MSSEKTIDLQVFPLAVHYSESLEDMVLAGKYDYTNEHITTSNFPLQGIGNMEIESVLVHFDCNIINEKAIGQMEQMGLLPAKIEHLLALGSKYPDLQRKHLIISLGSSWTDFDGCSMPCLCGLSDERSLRLHLCDGEWDSDYHFLAVRTF